MQATIKRFVRALGLGAMVLAAGEASAAPPASGTVNANVTAGSNAASGGSVNANVAGGSNAAALNGAGPANGMGNGAVGIAPNGIWPYGVAPNGNGAMTAQPAPAVPNPALYPNVYSSGTRENSVMTARPAPAIPNPALYPNVNSNGNVSNGNFNSNGGANVNPNMNQRNQTGAWRWRQSPQSAAQGFGARNYNLQSFSQFNNYGGRTFARGNPQYFGIRRYYANGSYFSGFRANQGR